MGKLGFMDRRYFKYMQNFPKCVVHNYCLFSSNIWKHDACLLILLSHNTKFRSLFYVFEKILFMKLQACWAFIDGEASEVCFDYHK